MTIVAVSTAQGAVGGIGVVRLSGAESLSIALNLFTVKGKKPELKPNMMTLGTLAVCGIKERAFCVYFAAPLSFTGEDVVEFHCHGGRAVLSAVLEEAVRLGAKPAGRGEFTKRAFLNGKMTLAEAEGVLDTIEAEGIAELNQASRLMSGELGNKISGVCEVLTDAASNLEAALDYPEELLDDMRDKTHPLLISARETLGTLASSGQCRRIIKEGATVALVGSPNVGKSSLLNAILKDNRAIVSAVPGTTRDTLSESVEYRGVRLNLVDTAGLRETEDGIEREGVRRAKDVVKGADLTVLVADTSNFDKEEFQKQRSEIGGLCLTVGNKTDVCGNCEYTFDYCISAKMSSGIEALLDGVLEALQVDDINHTTVVMRDRHLAAIRVALEFLDDALKSFATTTSDCLLVDIEGAVRALYEIVGRDVSADVIDKVFSRFCVGK